MYLNQILVFEWNKYRFVNLNFEFRKRLGIKFHIKENLKDKSEQKLFLI